MERVFGMDVHKARGCDADESWERVRFTCRVACWLTKQRSRISQINGENFQIKMGYKGLRCVALEKGEG